MDRPRWQEYVIAISLVGLACAGIASIWGQDIASWFRSEDPAPAAIDSSRPG
jgi:hypothetical protein